MFYCIIGVPLSGKSTMGKMIAEKLDISYFSTGDYARSLGMDPKEHSLKTMDLSISLNDQIIDRVSNEIFTKDPLILDGFPRSVDQLEFLNRTILEFKIVYLYEDPAVVIERARKRNRDIEDIYETVKGRIQGAVDLKLDLESECDNMIVYTMTGNKETDLKAIMVAINA